MNATRILIASCAAALLFAWGKSAALADFAPLITAPPLLSGEEGTALSFTVSGSDPDGDAIDSWTYDLYAILIGDICDDPLACPDDPGGWGALRHLDSSDAAATSDPLYPSLTMDAGNTSGTFTWTPTYHSARRMGVKFTAWNALSGSAVTEITIANVNGPPEISAEPRMCTWENLELLFSVSAADPDSDAIDTLTASGTAITAGGSFSPYGQNKYGTFRWTPAIGQAGSYSVTFAATNALRGTVTTEITVKARDHNRPPRLNEIPDQAVAAGSVSNLVVTGSDPDGDALHFVMWGNPPGFLRISAMDATHANIHMHPLPLDATEPPYRATVSADDCFSGDSGSFLITVYLPLAVDLDPNVINLKSYAPWVTACMEPSGFDPASIVVSSLRLAGSVPATPKFAIVGDRDRDGKPDLTVKFSRELLDPLLTIGTNKLEIVGSLVTGEEVRGSGEVRVINPSSAPVTATVAPNPLNPTGVLTFVTSKPGPATVKLFDLQGRLVRTLMEESFLPAGVKELRIDSKGTRGLGLASGLYFYRVETGGGAVTGRIVILK